MTEIPFPGPRARAYRVPMQEMRHIAATAGANRFDARWVSPCACASRTVVTHVVKPVRSMPGTGLIA